MPPKNRIEQPLDQGQLFPVEISRQHPAVIGEAVEGGVFPDDMDPPTEGATHLHDAIHTAVVEEQKTRNRHNAQLGKHSPLERDGHYLGVKPGDVLPDFGIVTYKNESAAISHAGQLEAKRLAALSAQPMLTSPSRTEVNDAIHRAADALDIRHGLALPGEAPVDPELATTKIKLEALRDDSRAGFLPTTHREKTSAYELLDYVEPGKHERGVSTRLDQIFMRQQREMKKNGMNPYEARDVAVDSVRSIIREWGDYYSNAKSSWTKLDNVQKLVDGIYPNLSIEELLEDQGNGEVLTQVVRHGALKQFRDTDQPLGFDPLWVREDRSKPTGEKHKTVEDMFTHQNEEFMAAYVRRRVQQMTAGQIRRGILELKRDQANRGKFWRGSIESLDDDYKEFADLALKQTT